MTEVERYIFLAIAAVVILSLARLTLLVAYPVRTSDRCTLIERDHDDRSTPETRARLSDGQ